MNAAATGGEEETTVKKANEENRSHSMDGAAPVDDSASLSQTTTQPAGAEGTEPEELPRKRRGILLGARPGQALPAAADDGKSLSWMATQAVKAVNAVKASQLEQAQAWKAEAGTPDDEPPRLTEGDDVVLERQEPAQSFPGGQSASTQAVHVGKEYPGAPLDIEAGMPASGPLPASLPLTDTAVTEQSFTDQTVQPVEPSQEGATNPRIPAGAHRAAASLVPVRMALLLGVLAMFSYAGYRYWFAGDRAASEVPGSTSAIIEPAGPAEEAGMMTPPAISVVAVPEHAAGQSTPPAVEAEMAPMAGPASDVQPAPAGVADAPEVPAAAAQEAATANIPQPAPAHPASAAVPQTWYPSAVPAAPASAAGAEAAASQPPPASAVETDVVASHPPPPSSSFSPAAEVDTAASQPAPPPSPAPAVEARVPTSQPAPPAPAARPRYPANGYGYYQPPASWQPYYQPGYQQSPARR